MEAGEMFAWQLADFANLPDRQRDEHTRFGDRVPGSRDRKVTEALPHLLIGVVSYLFIPGMEFYPGLQTSHRGAHDRRHLVELVDLLRDGRGRPVAEEWQRQAQLTTWIVLACTTMRAS